MIKWIRNLFKKKTKPVINGYVPYHPYVRESPYTKRYLAPSYTKDHREKVAQKEREDSSDWVTPAVIGYALGSSHQTTISDDSSPSFSGGGGTFGGGGASGSWDSGDSGSSSSDSSCSSSDSSSSSSSSGSYD